MDLIIRNVRLAADPAAGPVDIGIANGEIVAIEKSLAAVTEVYDACGRLACGGLVETHI
ncbi:MAG: amidohydrolase, partial [Alphaproteobacteria bacterium]|nr:amidohydrolase [Alphaproteobacteria bacterium]